MKHLSIGLSIIIIAGVVCYIFNMLDLFAKVAGIIGGSFWAASFKVVSGSWHDPVSDDSYKKRADRFDLSRKYFLLGLPSIIALFIFLNMN